MWRLLGIAVVAAILLYTLAFLFTFLHPILDPERPVLAVDRILAAIFIALLLIYIFVELTKGGGNPRAR